MKIALKWGFLIVALSWIATMFILVFLHLALRGLL